jgi:hypothetical protein
MRGVGLLFLFPLACGPDGRPGFGGQGNQLQDPADTAYDGLREVASARDIRGNADVADCIGRAEIELHSGDSPPAVEGAYQLEGEVVVSDTWPVGSAVSSAMCLYDQAPSGAIAMGEEAGVADSTAAQGWIEGSDSELTVYLELLVEARDVEGCLVQTLAVFSGSVDERGDIAMRTAAVPVAVDGCDDGYDVSLGVCWATAVTATFTGECAS